MPGRQPQKLGFREGAVSGLRVETTGRQIPSPYKELTNRAAQKGSQEAAWSGVCMGGGFGGAKAMGHPTDRTAQSLSCDSPKAM